MLAIGFDPVQNSIELSIMASANHDTVYACTTANAKNASSFTNLLSSIFWFQLSNLLCNPKEPMHELHRKAPQMTTVVAIFILNFFMFVIQNLLFV